MDKMKVKFFKDYKHTIKTFKKGAIVPVDNQFGAFLIKKKIAESTTEITEEEKAIKKELNNK